MFVRFRDFSSYHWIYAYVVDKDEHTFHYIDPLTYRWLDAINALDRLKEVRSKRFGMNLYHTTYERLPNQGTPFYGESRLTHFPFEEDDLYYLDDYASLFKYISFSFDKLPQFFESLSRGVRLNYFYFTEVKIKKIINFYLSMTAFRDQDRLTLLRYPILLPYFDQALFEKMRSKI